MTTSATTPARPLGSRILVRQEAWKEKIGSLYIPQNHREGYEDTAVIIAIGPKSTIDAKVADRVMFKRRPASALVPDIREGDPLGLHGVLRLEEDDILAVVED
ncbi:MAG TPA: hypothetical protein VNT29_10530 [Candidatus Limnocylindrales bacterium]|nr:hypothetical protein [Candidatus Limnocylindrales bacterium]